MKLYFSLAYSFVGRFVISVLLWASAVLALFGPNVARADTPLESSLLFSGRNVYSPAVVYDEQEGLYKMWYGGWQTEADCPVRPPNEGCRDKIYFRTSQDNINWSTPLQVLHPSDVSPQAVHLNDPTVTKHFNSASGQWQYTMFYTVCMVPCEQSDNQIWSSVSNDGIHWLAHRVLLAGPSGPAEPSAIVEEQLPGQFWKVYYVDRNDGGKIKLAKVNGNRNATFVQVVFLETPDITSMPFFKAVANPEVANYNGQWHLFFNIHFSDRTDIYKSESLSNEFWLISTPLIENDGPDFCATVAPGVLVAALDLYDLYFGLTPRTSPFSCDLTEQQGIHRWRWIDS